MINKVDKIWDFWVHYNISFLIIFVFGAIKTNITHAMIFIMLAWEIIAQKAVKGHFHFLYHTTSEERKWCWIICQVVCQIMPCKTPSLFGRIYEIQRITILHVLTLIYQCITNIQYWSSYIHKSKDTSWNLLRKRKIQ